MKLLTFLFAIYILLLPCLPCMDRGECEDDSQTTVLSPANHDTHQHENEICNPFCSCSCCGHSLVSQGYPVKTSGITPLIKQQELDFYKNISLSSDFFGNIWQPPKV